MMIISVTLRRRQRSDPGTDSESQQLTFDRLFSCCQMMTGKWSTANPQQRQARPFEDLTTYSLPSSLSHSVEGVSRSPSQLVRLVSPSATHAGTRMTWSAYNQPDSPMTRSLLGEETIPLCIFSFPVCQILQAVPDHFREGRLGPFLEDREATFFFPTALLY